MLAPVKGVKSTEVARALPMPNHHPNPNPDPDPDPNPDPDPDPTPNPDPNEVARAVPLSGWFEATVLRNHELARRI